jgi:hypothetical protein
MSLFSYKPNVSKKEFRKVCADLRKEGFNLRQIKEVEQTFLGDIKEKGSQRGIDEKEIEKGIGWMKENKDFLRIEEEKIDFLEKRMREELK